MGGLIPVRVSRYLRVNVHKCTFRRREHFLHSCAFFLPPLPCEKRSFQHIFSEGRLEVPYPESGRRYGNGKNKRGKRPLARIRRGRLSAVSLFLHPPPSAQFALFPFFQPLFRSQCPLLRTPRLKVTPSSSHRTSAASSLEQRIHCFFILIDLVIDSCFSEVLFQSYKLFCIIISHQYNTW